jgi:uncharacterized OB-fold protein
MSDGPPPRFIAAGPESEFYWTSGADGRLRIQHCGDCDRWIHPPGPVCPFCHSRNVAPAPVSGRGTVATFTVNHKEWIPGFTPPYVFAFVEIDEDPTIRLGTNIVGCPPEEVEIGMRVEVEFEENGDHFVPLFHPLTDTGDA